LEAALAAAIALIGVLTLRERLSWCGVGYGFFPKQRT
jgi:hypothetical protein